LPGTLNRKHEPRLCSVVQADWKLRYTLQDFERFRQSSSDGADTERKREATDGQRIPQGKRHPTLVSLAGTMRKRGMTAQEIEAALLVVNAERCAPPLPAAQVHDIAIDIARRYAPDASGAAWESDAALPKLVAVSLEKFLAHEFKPREMILAPWLTCQSLVMVYAWRGTGKTYFGLELAYAVASGGEYLGWKAPRPRKVFFVDGEMPGGLLQERLARVVAASELHPAPGMLTILTPDMQEGPMPDLATLGGQARLAEVIDDDTELMILDPLSALARRGGRENESESWLAIEDWGLQQRRRGRAAMFVHHAGKSGDQRGTSKREDVLDVSLCLQRPPGYELKEGAVFRIIWKKGRGLHGKVMEPFEATLAEKDGQRIWLTKPVALSTLERVAALKAEGLSQSEVAEELGIHRSNVNRAWKRVKAQRGNDE
jgi:DNA-binding CsgD family transcriptional regulator